MDVEIRWEGNNITTSVVEYSREQHICTGIGTLDVLVEANTARAFAPWDTMILKEEGITVGTYNVSSIEEAVPQNTYRVSCQDNSKRLQDYFIKESYLIDYYSTAKYWIDLFATEAGVTVTYTATGYGGVLSNNTQLGITSAYDAIVMLLQLSGWYMYFDNSGDMVVGDLKVDTTGFAETITDDEVINLQSNKNDHQLRNRVVVWGRSDQDGNTVFAELKVMTPWNYGENDYRTIVLANPNIRSTADAYVMGYQLLNEFSHLTHVKTIEVKGVLDVNLGDYVYLNSSFMRATGMITSIVSEASANGLTTTLTLDERCPRLFGFFSYDGYVYVGTEADGIWRKPFEVSTWLNFSTGLTVLDVQDLDINENVFAAVVGSGSWYKYDEFMSWQPFTPSGLSYHPSDTTISGYIPASGYVPSGLLAVATTLDTYNNNNIVVAFTASGIDTASGIEPRSWAVQYTPTGIQLFEDEMYVYINEQRLFDVTVLDIENDGFNNYAVVHRQWDNFPIFTNGSGNYGKLETDIDSQGSYYAHWQGYSASGFITFPYSTSGLWSWDPAKKFTSITYAGWGHTIVAYDDYDTQGEPVVYAFRKASSPNYRVQKTQFDRYPSPGWSTSEYGMPDVYSSNDKCLAFHKVNEYDDDYFSFIFLDDGVAAGTTTNLYLRYYKYDSNSGLFVVDDKEIFDSLYGDSPLVATRIDVQNTQVNEYSYYKAKQFGNLFFIVYWRASDDALRLTVIDLNDGNVILNHNIGTFPGGYSNFRISAPDILPIGSKYVCIPILSSAYTSGLITGFGLTLESIIYNVDTNQISLSVEALIDFDNAVHYFTQKSPVDPYGGLFGGDTLQYLPNMVWAVINDAETNSGILKVIGVFNSEPTRWYKDIYGTLFSSWAYGVAHITVPGNSISVQATQWDHYDELEDEYVEKGVPFWISDPNETAYIPQAKNRSDQPNLVVKNTVYYSEGWKTQLYLVDPRDFSLELQTLEYIAPVPASGQLEITVGGQLDAVTDSIYGIVDDYYPATDVTLRKGYSWDPYTGNIDREFGSLYNAQGSENNNAGDGGIALVGRVLIINSHLYPGNKDNYDYQYMTYIDWVPPIVTSGEAYYVLKQAAAPSGYFQTIYKGKYPYSLDAAKGFPLAIYDRPSGIIESSPISHLIGVNYHNYQGWQLSYPPSKDVYDLRIFDIVGSGFVTLTGYMTSPYSRVLGIAAGTDGLITVGTTVDIPFNQGNIVNTFSGGAVTHLEATNYDQNPRLFVTVVESGTGDLLPSGRFYERPPLMSGWLNFSIGLPNSRVTIIRTDDRI